MELIAAIEETLACEGRSVVRHAVTDHAADIRACRRWSQRQMMEAVVLAGLAADEWRPGARSIVIEGDCPGCPTRETPPRQAIAGAHRRPSPATTTS